MTAEQNKVKQEQKRIKAGNESEGYSIARKKLIEDVKSVNAFRVSLKAINAKLGKKLTSLDEVEQYLTARAGFPNLDIASEVLMVKGEYQNLKQQNRPEVDMTLLEEVKGVLDISTEAMGKLRDSFNQYVCPELEKDALVLLEFKANYEQMSPQLQRAFVQFRGTNIKVKLENLTYIIQERRL